MSLRLAAPAVATAEALPEIAGLLERVFPRDRPWAADLEWQYLENPSGRARYLNGYAESGALIAHYALLPMPPLAEPPVELAACYLSLNVAADPGARIPGLMLATTRALYRDLASEGPVLVLGVANENAFQGFSRMLRFRSLGRLALSLHLPGTLPRARAPRALTHDRAHLVWRASRPGVSAFADPVRGALLTRLHYRGMPLDAVLTTGLPAGCLEPLGLRRPAGWTPRLYAGFGPHAGGGFWVPERLRPSPLEYVFRVFGDEALNEPLHRHLLTRRFEFLDFDVV